MKSMKILTILVKYHEIILFHIFHEVYIHFHQTSESLIIKFLNSSNDI